MNTTIKAQESCPKSGVATCLVGQSQSLKHSQQGCDRFGRGLGATTLNKAKEMARIPVSEEDLCW